MNERERFEKAKKLFHKYLSLDQQFRVLVNMGVVPASATSLSQTELERALDQISAENEGYRLLSMIEGLLPSEPSRNLAEHLVAMIGGDQNAANMLALQIDLFKVALRIELARAA